MVPHTIINNFSSNKWCVSPFVCKTNVSNLIDKFIDAEILREMTGKVRHRRFSYEDYLNLFTTEKKL